jgi:hypothetical protein
MVSNKAIELFRAAYQDAYGEHISMSEAQEMAQRILMLYERIYTPLPTERDEPSERAEDDLPSSLHDDKRSP